MSSRDYGKLDKLSAPQNDTRIDDAELENLYSWIDGFPLTRPKKNLARDFSDGVPIAEIVHQTFPSAVEPHNFSPANSKEGKMGNWSTLNRKVFQKFNFVVDGDLIDGIVSGKFGYIEQFLMYLRMKLDRAEWERQRQPPPVKKKHFKQGRTESDKPEADQYVGSPGRGKGPGAKGVRGLKGPEMWNEQTRGKIIRDPMEADVVPRLVYEEKAQENLAKDETIKILDAKLHRLEHLLHLKDLRIDDLQKQVEINRPTGGYRKVRYEQHDKTVLPYYSGREHPTESTSCHVEAVMYENMEQNSESKDDVIEALEAKLRRLDHLSLVKDMKIQYMNSSTNHPK